MADTRRPAEPAFIRIVKSIGIGGLCFFTVILINFTFRFDILGLLTFEGAVHDVCTWVPGIALIWFLLSLYRKAKHVTGVVPVSTHLVRCFYASIAMYAFCITPYHIAMCGPENAAMWADPRHIPRLILHALLGLLLFGVRFTLRKKGIHPFGRKKDPKPESGKAGINETTIPAQAQRKEPVAENAVFRKHRT